MSTDLSDFTRIYVTGMPCTGKTTAIKKYYSEYLEESKFEGLPQYTRKARCFGPEVTMDFCVADFENE